MLSIDEIRTKAKVEMAKQRSGRMSPNDHRRIGLVLFAVTAIPLAVINVWGFMATGRMFVLLVAANIVMVGLSVVMMVTGKNPLRK